MSQRTPQYQGHIIDPDEEGDGPQKIGNGKGPLLGGLILISLVLIMVATSFLFKSFGGHASSAAPTTSSDPTFFTVPVSSDLPFVTAPVDQANNLTPVALGEPLAGWKLVGVVDSLSNTEEVWTTLADQPSRVAVHLICYGYDEILVTLGRSIRTVDNPYLTQSAVFYCQAEGKDARIIFDPATEGSFNQLMIMPMHYPSNGQVDRWVAGIEEPVCGNYTGAFPGAGLDICPSTVPTSSPAVAESPSTATSSPAKH
jgi:hypothetical protein